MNGSTVNVGVHPLKVVIVKLRSDKDRKSQLVHKAKGCVAADKDKVTKFNRGYYAECGGLTEG